MCRLCIYVDVHGIHTHVFGSVYLTQEILLSAVLYCAVQPRSVRIELFDERSTN